MYKYLHGDLPETFKNLDGNYLDGSNSCQTRNQSKLFPRFYRIELTKQSLKYRGPLTWNSISITPTQILLLVFVVTGPNSSSILLQDHFKTLLFTFMSISVLSIIFFFNRY